MTDMDRQMRLELGKKAEADALAVLSAPGTVEVMPEEPQAGPTLAPAVLAELTLDNSKGTRPRRFESAPTDE